MKLKDHIEEVSVRPYEGSVRRDEAVQHEKGCVHRDEAEDAK